MYWEELKVMWNYCFSVNYFLFPYHHLFSGFLCFGVVYFSQHDNPPHSQRIDLCTRFLYSFPPHHIQTTAAFFFIYLFLFYYLFLVIILLIFPMHLSYVWIQHPSNLLETLLSFTSLSFSYISSLHIINAIARERTKYFSFLLALFSSYSFLS